MGAGGKISLAEPQELVLQAIGKEIDKAPQLYTGACDEAGLMLRYLGVSTFGAKTTP